MTERTVDGIPGVQFFLPMKDGVTPQLYLRMHNVKYNDNTVVPTLQYFSSCGGGWMTSSCDRLPQAEYIKTRLKHISELK